MYQKNIYICAGKNILTGFVQYGENTGKRYGKNCEIHAVGSDFCIRFLRRFGAGKSFYANGNAKICRVFAGTL